MDFETFPVFTFNIRASAGPDSSVALVNVTVSNDNDSPIIPQGQVLSIAENSASSAFIGTVSASDADGDPLTFANLQVSPTDVAARLALVTGTGVVRVGSGTSTQPEASDSLSFEQLLVARGFGTFHDLSTSGAAAGFPGGAAPGPLPPIATRASMLVEATDGVLPSTPTFVNVSVVDVDEPPVVAVPSAVEYPWAALDSTWPSTLPVFFIVENTEPGTWALPSPALARQLAESQTNDSVIAPAAANTVACVDPDLARDQTCTLKVKSLPRGLHSMATAFASHGTSSPLAVQTLASAATCDNVSSVGWAVQNSPGGNISTACLANTAVSTPYGSTMVLQQAASLADLPNAGARSIGEHTTSLEPAVKLEQLTLGMVSALGLAPTSAAPNFEARSSYGVAVQVEDDAGNTAVVVGSLRVLDAEDPTTLQPALTRIVTVAENGQGALVSDSDIAVLDEDDEVLGVRFAPPNLAKCAANFTLLPAGQLLPRAADGSRPVIQLSVPAHAFLEASQFSCGIEVFKPASDTVVATTDYLIVVDDINDVPEVVPQPEPITLAENSAPGTLVAVLNATDKDLRQNLTFAITNALSGWFEVQHELVPCTDDSPDAPALVQRSALLLLRDDTVDYEAMAARNWTYDIALQVSDTPFVRSQGAFILDPRKSAHTVTFTLQVRVLDKADPPAISSVTVLSPYGLSTVGSDLVAIRGSNLGSGLDAHPDVPFRLTAVYTTDPTRVAEVGGVVAALQQSCSANTAQGVVVLEAQVCTVVVRHTEVHCQVSPGFGEGHRWMVVTGGLQYVTGGTAFAYDSARVPALRAQSRWPQTRDAFLGCSGVVNASVPEMCAVGAGHRACPTLPQPPAEGTPSTCVGVSSAVLPCPRIAQTSGWSADVTGYGSPSVLTVQGPGASDAVTQGGEMVRLTGTNFGLQRHNAVSAVSYGPQGTEFSALACSVTRSHAEISCITGVGVGNRLQWQVSIADLSSAVPITDYAPPNVTRTLLIGSGGGPGGPPVNLSTGGGGGFTLRIEGSNFGPLSSPTSRRALLDSVGTAPRLLASANASVDIAVQVGPLDGSAALLQAFPASDCAVVVPHSAIECAAPAGIGVDLAVQVSVAGQSGVGTSCAVRVSYAPPALLPPAARPVLSTVSGGRVDAFGSNFAGASGRTVSVFGSQLFNVTQAGAQFVVQALPSPLPRVLGATDVTDVSPSQVKLSLPPGEGAAVPLQVVVGSQASNTIIAADYGAAGGAATAFTIQSQSVPDENSQDGPVYARLESSVVSPCCWALRTLAAGRSPGQSAFTPCYTGDSTAGSYRTFPVLAGDGSVAATLSTDPLVNAQQYLATHGHACHCEAADPAYLQVSLSDGGVQDAAEVVAVWDRPSTSVLVRMCGVRGTLALSAANRTRSLGAEVFDYFKVTGAPSITTITPATIPAGGGTLSIAGRNFGNVQGRVWLRERGVCSGTVTEQPLVVLSWAASNVSGTEPFLVRVQVPPGVPGGRRQLLLSSAGGTGGNVSAVSEPRSLVYADPSNLALAAGSGPTQGFQFAREPGNLAQNGAGEPVDAPLLRLTGLNLGVRQVFPISGNCSDAGLLAEGSAFVAGQPSWSRVDPARRAPLRVLVGPRQCPIVDWSDTSITCRAPEGLPTSDAIRVEAWNGAAGVGETAQWQTLVPTVASAGVNAFAPEYTYTLPVVTRASLVVAPESPTYGPTVGGAVVQLRGSSFGATHGDSTLVMDFRTASLPALELVGGSHIVEWTHTSILFRTPLGIGASARLRLTVAGQASAVEVPFAYDPPALGHLTEIITTESGGASAGRPDGEEVELRPTSSVNGSLALINAANSGLRVTGRNFGSVQQGSDSVSVGGVPCLPPTGATSVLVSDTRLECEVTGLTVGPKNLTLTVAGQSTFVPANQSRLVAECRAGFYGVVPDVDTCRPCPQCDTSDCRSLNEAVVAALCSGRGEEPVAAPGFWRHDSYTDVAFSLPAGADVRGAVDASITIPPKLLQNADFTGGAAVPPTQLIHVPPNANATMAQRVADAVAARFGSGARYEFTRCEPPTACIGDNTCAVGYESDACALCVAGKFQRDFLTNECRACPPEPILNFVLIIVVAVFAGLLLYKLYQKGPSVAALGIAVDYLQIISVFGTLNLQWPPAVLQLFRVAAASAASVDTASPECAVSIGYIAKWYFIMLVPMTVGSVYFLFHIFVVAVKAVRRRHTDMRGLHKHANKMVGSWFLLCSFLYITLTGKAFEALACKQVASRPVLTVDPAVSCESPEYLQMRSWALVGLVAYGLGIPALFATIIYMYGARMQLDQALRIRNLSGSRDTNPYYDMQKRYKRLYFKFKPEYHYWILVVLGRKFLIVAFTFVLQRRPVMAATVITMVLFGAAMLQMLYSPYRSHNTKAAAKDDTPGKPTAPTPSTGALKLGPAGDGKTLIVTSPLGVVPPSDGDPSRDTQRAQEATKGIQRFMRGRGVRLEDLADDEHLMLANDPSVMAAAIAAQRKAATGGVGQGGGRSRGDSLFARIAGAGGLGRSARTPSATTAHTPLPRSAARAGAQSGSPTQRTPAGKDGVWTGLKSRTRGLLPPPQPRAEVDDAAGTSGACAWCPLGCCEQLCDPVHRTLCAGRCCASIGRRCGCAACQGVHAPTPLRLPSSQALRQRAAAAALSAPTTSAGSSAGASGDPKRRFIQRRYSLAAALGPSGVQGGKGDSVPSLSAWQRTRMCCARVMPCCQSNKLKELQLRSAARTGGKLKIKLKYFFNYNMLESTFLVCAIFVLLAGIMFKSVDCDIQSDAAVGVAGDAAIGDAGGGSSQQDADIERRTLEAVVLAIIAVSTVICIATVAAELWLGCKYYLAASRARRRAEREARRKAVAKSNSPSKGRPVSTASVRLTAEDPESTSVTAEIAACIRRGVSGCVRCLQRTGRPCHCACVCLRKCPGYTAPQDGGGSDEEEDGVELPGVQSSVQTARERAESRAALRTTRRSMAWEGGGDSFAEEVWGDDEFGRRSWSEDGMRRRLQSLSGLKAAPPSAPPRKASTWVAGVNAPQAPSRRHLMPATPARFEAQKHASSVSVHEAAVRRVAIMQRLAALRKKAEQVHTAEQAAATVVGRHEAPVRDAPRSPTGRFRDSIVVPGTELPSDHPRPRTRSTGRRASQPAPPEAVQALGRAPVGPSGVQHVALAAAHYGLLKRSALPAESLSTLGTLAKGKAYTAIEAEEQRSRWASKPVVGPLFRGGKPAKQAPGTKREGATVSVTSPLAALGELGDHRIAELGGRSEVPVDPKSKKGKPMRLPKDVAAVAGDVHKDLTKRQARYVMSMYVASVQGIDHADVESGTHLTLTLRKDQHKQRVVFPYRPGHQVRVREMRLLLVDPARDAVHGTLALDTRGRKGLQLLQQEHIIGVFSFKPSEFPLDNTALADGAESDAPRHARTFTLTDFEGAEHGSISLLCRLQHRGTAVDDWTDLGLGARDFAQLARTMQRPVLTGPAKPAPRTIVSAGAVDLQDIKGIAEGRSGIAVAGTGDFSSADVRFVSSNPLTEADAARGGIASVTWTNTGANRKATLTTPHQPDTVDSGDLQLKVVPMAAGGSITVPLRECDEATLDEGGSPDATARRVRPGRASVHSIRAVTTEAPLRRHRSGGRGGAADSASRPMSLQVAAAGGQPAEADSKQGVRDFPGVGNPLAMASGMAAPDGRMAFGPSKGQPRGQRFRKRASSVERITRLSSYSSLKTGASSTSSSGRGSSLRGISEQLEGGDTSANPLRAASLSATAPAPKTQQGGRPASEGTPSAGRAGDKADS